MHLVPLTVQHARKHTPWDELPTRLPPKQKRENEGEAHIENGRVGNIPSISVHRRVARPLRYPLYRDHHVGYPEGL